MTIGNEKVEAGQLDEPLRVPRLGRIKTHEPRSYRDKYEGRGKYANENDAMLDQEQVRLDAWRDESTLYRPTNVRLLFVAAGLLLTATVLSAVWFFVFGIQRGPS